MKGSAERLRSRSGRSDSGTAISSKQPTTKSAPSWTRWKVETGPRRKRKLQEKTMKAIRVREFGGPEVMRVEEVPDPKPGKGEVVVQIHAAGVNPVDAYIRSGTYPRKPPLPYTPGSDAGGVVESAGEGVTR